MFIGGTKFPHKDIHKYTWERADDYNCRNQIDHILISKLFLGCLLDVKTRRGADIHSDHQLLVGTFKLRPAAHNNHNKHKRYNVSRLLNPQTQAAYESALSSNFQRGVCYEWNYLANACKNTAESVLGISKREHKAWISEQTLQQIKIRRKLKQKLNHTKATNERNKCKEEYRQAARRVKQMTRADCEHFYNNIALDLEKASNTGNLRDVYSCIQELSGKSKTASSIIKDNNGNDLTDIQHQLDRWSEFFASEPPGQNEIPEFLSAARHNPDRRISTDQPSVLEVRNILEKLKNQKSPGNDDIPAELLKYGAQTAAEVITPILTKAWSSNTIPHEWKEGVIVTVPKKGDLSMCSNWRGITLQNAICKVMALLILERISPVIEPLLRNEQAGFRPNRSCVDHINTLRILIEQSTEYNEELCLLFIDFERAFDTISRNALWSALAVRGIPEKIINLIKEMYSGSTSVVRFNNHESNPFTSERGVKQGCVLSPTLFLILLDCVMKQANDQSPRGIRWTLNDYLSDIDYADDICLITQTLPHMQEKISKLSEIAESVGLKINIKKTKLMRIRVTKKTKKTKKTTNTTDTIETPLTVNGKLIEEVDSFCYLGSTLTKAKGSEKDIYNRINKARVAFHSLYKVWRSNHISRRTKLRIFNCSVLSVLLYGSTTWGTTMGQIANLQTFVNRCLRQILGIFWPNWVTNEQLLTLANCQPIGIEIKKRKWMWIGHILRRPLDDITRVALEWNPPGYRNPGRPPNTWRRTILKDCQDAGERWSEVKCYASDPVRWKEFTVALCSAN